MEDRNFQDFKVHIVLKAAFVMVAQKEPEGWII